MSDSPNGVLEVLNSPFEEDYFIDRTLTYLETKNFPEKYADERTRLLGKQIDALESPLSTVADKQARRSVKIEAARRLNLPVSEASRLPGRAWQDALKATATEITDDTGGLTMRRYLYEQFMAQLAAEEPAASKLAATRSFIGERRQAALIEGQALLAELRELQADPRFIQACGLWAFGTDSWRYAGPDGRGLNGGLIHFFQHRSVKAKSDRFKFINEPMTVEGFIAFSNRLFGQLAEAMVMGQHLLGQLIDEQGNKRVYVLCGNGEFIVAFQRAYESRPRLNSMRPGVRPEHFDTVVNETANGKDRGNLNKLGTQVIRLI